jgi:NADH:ubiquinone oxidoreductase subunit 2 (subunit N)
MRLGCINFLTLIVLLEVLSWVFVVLLPINSSLNYLVVQSYFLIGRLRRVLFNSYLLLILRLLMKIGLPPFHIWLIRVARVLNKETFSFLITGHKLLPLFLLRKLILSVVSFTLITIRLVVIITGLIRRRTIFYTLMFSSILNSL